MTPLINTKIRSNTDVAEDGTFSMGAESTRLYRRINNKSQISSSNRGSNILRAFFNAGSFFKMMPINESIMRDCLNQSIIIEERIKTKITLAEAKKMAIYSMKRYEDSWNIYLKDESNKYFSVND